MRALNTHLVEEIKGLMCFCYLHYNAKNGGGKEKASFIHCVCSPLKEIKEDDWMPGAEKRIVGEMYAA